MAFGSDKYQPRETRYLAEYVAKMYANENIVMRAPLGEVPADLMARFGVDQATRAFRGFQRWADALILRANETIIIEAKLRATPDAVGQLVYYRTLFFKTPRYTDRRLLPVRSVLLTPWSDPDVIEHARANDVEVVVQVPDWLDAYIKDRQKYTTTAYRREREAQGKQKGER